MSTLVSKNVQIGADGTASNNFTLYQPAAPDGTLRLGNGNSGITSSLLTLTSAGNLGIGTSNPSGFLGNKLVIATGGTANEGITIYSSSNNGSLWFADATSGAGMYAGGIDYQHSTNELVFYANSQGNMRLDASGNLGLGVTPAAGVRFDVRNNSTTTLADMRNANSAGFGIYIAAGSSTSQYVQRWADYNNNALATLDASGNLSVGTTSPSGRLHIATGGETTSRFDGSRGSADNLPVVTIPFWNVSNGVGDKQIATIGVLTGTSSNQTQKGQIYFSTSDGTLTERARIDSSGHLLVGCTSIPGAGSTTQGVSLLSSGAFSGFRTAATPFFCGRSNDGEIMALYSGATQRGQVSISGATTTYGSFSDYRLKENIVPLTGAVAKVMALKPSTFNFIEFPEQTINGFIAHEVAEVEPIAVTGQKDAVDEEGKQLYQSVDPAKLVPLLTAAIQEQQAIIESLKARLDAANL